MHQQSTYQCSIFKYDSADKINCRIAADKSVRQQLNIEN